MVGMPLAIRRAGCALTSVVAVFLLAAASGQRRARGGRHRGQGVAGGERRAAADLPDRSVQRDPGPERDQQRDHPPEAAGRRLDHPHPARPGLHERPGAGRGRDPPAPRRVGQPQPSQRHHAGPARAVRGRRRGEDHHQLPEGLRLPVPRLGHVAAQPHDPQPHAGADPGVHGLRDRLHPAQLAAGARHQAGHPDLDGRAEGQRVPGLRRPEGLRARGALHLSRRRAERLRGP